MQWGLLLRLCAVGFFSNCKPSEPFLTQYLVDDKGFTADQLADSVWPYYTYTSFAVLLPIGIMAEVCGYRATVLFGLLLREVTRVVLIYGRTLGWMAVTQLSFATSTAVDTVYFAYVYMVVPRDQFQTATGYIRAAFHIGNVVGSVVGQVMVSYLNARLLYLFYASWAFVSLGLVSFAFLPPRRHVPPPSLANMLLTDGAKRTWAELRRMYRHPTVWQWSLWWLIGFGSAGIITNYYQTQFLVVDPNGAFGTVEAVMELCLGIGSVLPALVPVAVARHGAALIALSSVAIGALWLASTYVTSPATYVYAFNVLAMTLYGVQYAAASAAIAYCIASSAPRYAVVFTANSFVSLALATVVQQLGAQLQWSVNGFYDVAAYQQLALGVIFAAVGLYLHLFPLTPRRRETDPDLYTTVAILGCPTSLSEAEGTVQ